MKQLDYIPEYHNSHAGRGLECDDPEPKAYELDDNMGVVVVEWSIDNDGYAVLDYLGKYTDKREEYVIDRKIGILLGEGDPEPEMEGFLPEKYRGDAEPYIPENDIPDDVWRKAEEDWDEAWDAWNDKHGYGEAACDLSTWRSSREYRFFRVGQDYLEHEWKFSNKSIQEYYADALRKMRRYSIPQLAGVEGEPTRKQATRCLSILYMVQDYERMEDYNKGDWGMLNCWAYLYLNGESVDYEVVCGIESDASESDFAEVERQQIGEVTG